LAPQEMSRLRALPSAQRSAAFTELWVCKEAYVKALGEGLNRSLRDIFIAPAPGGGYALQHDRAGTALSWNFVMVDVGLAHAACLAYPGSKRPLHIHDEVEPALQPGSSAVQATSLPTS
jgi:4'-phosphopantetheinyl transferase